MKKECIFEFRGNVFALSDKKILLFNKIRFFCTTHTFLRLVRENTAKKYHSHPLFQGRFQFLNDFLPDL